jgi:hypothetical protein
MPNLLDLIDIGREPMGHPGRRRRSDPRERGRAALLYCAGVTLQVRFRGMKQRPNHRIYIRVLQDMGPEKRLRKAFELSEFARALTRQGLQHLYPELPPDEIKRLYLDRMKTARDRPD